jgi:ABC-type transport system substrate-binding protein
VRIELEPSPPAAGDRWRGGDYDLIYEGLAAIAGAVATDDTVVQRASGGFTYYLGLDARRSPLNDARIRRAVAHAIDRQKPAQILGGAAAATGGLLPPAMPGHSHRVAPAFDPERARALLRDAGHLDGRGLGEIVLAHFGIWEAAASDIAAQLGAVGIRVRRLPANSVADLETVIEERANAYLWSWDYRFPDPGGGFLEPLLRWGTGLYRDEPLEQLLARAAALRDQDERLRAYREFERIWIGEQAAVVPITYTDRLLWRRPWVTGMWANAIAKSTFAEVVVRRP